MREWKEARRREKQLIKEIAVRDTQKLKAHVKDRKTKRIGRVNFVTQKFKPVDVNRMIQTGSQLVKAEPNTVSGFYGADEKNARIVVMAGKDAVKWGINAGAIAKEASSVLGGGGSGRPDFAQGGGTMVKKVTEALQKAAEVVRKQQEKE